MQTPNELTRDPPTFNPNIPLLTPNAGNPNAYKDPKSPESILRNLTQINVQGQADSVFDLDYEKVKANEKKETKEGFQILNTFSFLSFFLLLSLLFIQKKTTQIKVFSISLIVFVFLLASCFYKE